MLISSKTTLSDTPRIMTDKVSGRPVAQSSWYIKLTRLFLAMLQGDYSQFNNLIIIPWETYRGLQQITFILCMSQELNGTGTKHLSTVHLKFRFNWASKLFLFYFFSKPGTPWPWLRDTSQLHCIGSSWPHRSCKITNTCCFQPLRFGPLWYAAMITNTIQRGICNRSNQAKQS